MQNGTYNDFRTKYRSLDVLIVEDIQFLAGKTTTQEELYYLFDYLYQNNKQLIFSANSYPSAIAGMETYLYSKFEQGIVIGIEAPIFKLGKKLSHDSTRLINWDSAVRQYYLSSKHFQTMSVKSLEL